MAIKSIVFHGADNLARKGMLKAIHGLMHTMMHGKRTGDSIRVVMADGSVVDHVITNYGETPDGYQIDMAPGVVA